MKYFLHNEIIKVVHSSKKQDQGITAWQKGLKSIKYALNEPSLNRERKFTQVANLEECEEIDKEKQNSPS